ncbi:MAG: DegV family protein [Chloroflexota bacterium]|nr:DegV family protein [Chloroflexota bacterium]
MSIKIVTDSTCDLPEEITADLGVTVVPLYINVGQKSYLDGVEMSRQEFYERLPTFEDHPQTASPGPEMFRETYERLADEGAQGILSIHISISLSGTLNTAQLAAQATDAVPVTVFDSGQLSVGTGFLVQTAAKAAAAGRSIAEIVEALKERTRRTHLFAALDTLEFLQRSGRMNWAVSKIGGLLRIKPLLTMHDGEPNVQQVRTTKRAVQRLLDMLEDLAPLEELALVHTQAPETIRELRERARHLFPDGREPIEAVVTPVIGTHIGPGAAGFACVTARR